MALVVMPLASGIRVGRAACGLEGKAPRGSHSMVLVGTCGRGLRAHLLIGSCLHLFEPPIPCDGSVQASGGKRARRFRARAPGRSAPASLASEQRDALEDPGRDRRAGDRDPDRLVELGGFRLASARPRRAARPRPTRASNGSAAASAARAAAEMLAAAVAPDHLLERRRIVGRAVEDEARQRPEVGERLDLLRARSRPRRAARSRPVNSSSRAVSSSVLELAQVAPVEVAELAARRTPPGCLETRSRRKRSRAARRG